MLGACTKLFLHSLLGALHPMVLMGEGGRDGEGAWERDYLFLDMTPNGLDNGQYIDVLMVNIMIDRCLIQTLPKVVDG